MKKDRRDAAAFLDQKFTEHVYRVTAASRNEIAHPFAYEWLVSRVFHSNQQHSVPVANGKVVVVPAGQAIENIATNSRPKRGVSEALEHAGIAAVVGPRRDDRTQIVLPGSVGIHVGAYVVAFVTRFADH